MNQQRHDFACAALTGLLSSDVIENLPKALAEATPEVAREGLINIAKLAWIIADKMVETSGVTKPFFGE